MTDMLHQIRFHRCNSHTPGMPQLPHASAACPATWSRSSASTSWKMERLGSYPQVHQKTCYFCVFLQKFCFCWSYVWNNKKWRHNYRIYTIYRLQMLPCIYTVVFLSVILHVVTDILILHLLTSLRCHRHWRGVRSRRGLKQCSNLILFLLKQLKGVNDGGNPVQFFITYHIIRYIYIFIKGSLGI